MQYLRIKEILKEKGITAKQLAEDVGIAENSISRFITEKQQPRYEVLKRIADQLEVEIWQLFKGSEESVTGTLEYKGELHRIRTREDLERLLERMK